MFWQIMTVINFLGLLFLAAWVARLNQKSAQLQQTYSATVEPSVATVIPSEAAAGVANDGMLSTDEVHKLSVRILPTLDYLKHIQVEIYNGTLYELDYVDVLLIVKEQGSIPDISREHRLTNRIKPLETKKDSFGEVGIVGVPL